MSAILSAISDFRLILVVVWRGTSLADPTELVLVNRDTKTIQRYIIDILQDHVVTYALVIGNEFDNHIAIVVQDTFTRLAF